MTAAKQLKEIKDILNLALAPTIRIVKGIEYPMSEAEQVQWLANELRNKKEALQDIADDAAGEDL